jgi:uncharacterized protein (DUF362 family)
MKNERRARGASLARRFGQAAGVNKGAEAARKPLRRLTMAGTMHRREFMERTAAAGVGAAALGAMGTAALAADGKSVVVKAVREDSVGEGLKVNAKVAAEMVHAVVMKLSGKATPEEAWKTYIRADDVVGIKINCLFGVGACTHPEVTAAVVAGVRMAGVSPDRIIVWDREDGQLEKSGYTVGMNDGVLYTGVNGDWEDQPTDIHTCKGRIAKILTQKITALVNVPVLKTHALAGMTQALKNHYGSFHNPSDAHGPKEGRKVHGGMCDPFIAELNALPCIRNKTRLIVADALCPVGNQGPQVRPQFTWAEKTMMAATDPVAIDMVGMKMLDAWRAKNNLPGIEESGSGKCVFTAAEKGLGTADMAKIEIVTC